MGGRANWGREACCAASLVLTPTRDASYPFPLQPLLGYFNGWLVWFPISLRPLFAASERPSTTATLELDTKVSLAKFLCFVNFPTRLRRDHRSKKFGKIMTPYPNPPHQDISKKHKLPKVFLPPSPSPNERRQSQPIQPVAPLRTIKTEAGESEPNNSELQPVDILPPPPAYLMDHLQNDSNINAPESSTEPLPLDENEIRMIIHIRRNKINIQHFCELLRTCNFDPNNNQLEEIPNPISESVIRSELKADKRNKALPQASQLQQVESRPSQAMQAFGSIDDLFQLIYDKVKKSLSQEIKEYINKQIDEKINHYHISNNQKTVLKPIESPPAKKAKTPQQIQFVVTPAAVSQDPRNEYYQNFVQNQSIRQHQQTPQGAGQEYQQGKCNCNFQQSRWLLDPRLRLMMARSMQQQTATASNTRLYGQNSPFNGQAGQH